MHMPRIRPADAVVVLSMALAAMPASGFTLDCSHVRIDGADFDLSKLSGPHSVVTTRWNPPAHVNTTYTLDLCRNLVKKGDACPNGTRVCAIGHQINEGEGEGHGEITEPIIPIAGDLSELGGSALDVEVTRLKPGESQEDSLKDGGIRLVLKGGAFPLGGRKDEKREQRAIIEMRCNRNLTGTEGEYTPEDKYETSQRVKPRDGEEDKDTDKEKESTHERQLLKNDAQNPALKFVSYGADKEGAMLDILHLTWDTKYACENARDAPPEEGETPPGAHWGAFTWIVIIAFLGIAAYLIFGSWLNYNRYGARGWDLLPHGDTIRDIPYLMKDWTRRVLNTVQSGGSRGGYSAV